MVCPSQQNYGSLDTLFSGGTFPPNLAITACGAQRWLLIDRTHCDLDRNDDSSPTKKSTSYGSHSLNWGQGVKRMVLHLWHQTCVFTAFSSLRAVKMGLLVTHGHQLCLSTRHAVCTLPGGFPPCPRVIRSAFYLVGFLPGHASWGLHFTWWASSLSTRHPVCTLPGGLPPCLALGWGWKVRRGWCGKAVVQASGSHTSPTTLCSLRGGQAMRLRLSCAGFLSSAGWRILHLTSSSLKGNKSRFATYSFPD